MKYIENDDPLGVKPASPDIANMIMENLGYDTVRETPSIIAIDSDLFALSPEICTIEETLCIKLEELNDSLFESVKEDPLLTESVEFDELSLDFDEVVECDGDFYVTLCESVEEDTESHEDFVMELNGVEYDVTEDEDTADSFAFIVENDEGEMFVVDTEEEADFVVYLNEK